jgi:hypothetical protein
MSCRQLGKAGRLSTTIGTQGSVQLGDERSPASVSAATVERPRAPKAEVLPQVKILHRRICIDFAITLDGDGSDFARGGMSRGIIAHETVMVHCGRRTHQARVVGTRIE